jgi:hypothetical protein
VKNPGNLARAKHSPAAIEARQLLGSLVLEKASVRPLIFPAACCVHPGKLDARRKGEGGSEQFKILHLPFRPEHLTGIYIEPEVRKPERRSLASPVSLTGVAGQTVDLVLRLVPLKMIGAAVLTGGFVLQLGPVESIGVAVQNGDLDLQRLQLSVLLSRGSAHVISSRSRQWWTSLIWKQTPTSFSHGLLVSCHVLGDEGCRCGRVIDLG